MKIQISRSIIEYEIQMEQLTQLCGVDFEKKWYIIQSLYKYFSGGKYASYEEQMQDNIRIEGRKVGRKYFSVFHVAARESLINAIRISRSSMMAQYFSNLCIDFECQNIIDEIAEGLERLYLELNRELQSNMKMLEIGYSTKSIMEIVQISEVFGVGERALESLSNVELLDTYLELLWEMQRRKPEKCLVIFENIDHLLDYSSYRRFFEKAEQFCKEFDVWFLFSTSIEGFAVVDGRSIEGINVVNHCIFSFPELEQVVKFFQNQYPCQMKWAPEELCGEIRMIIQNIGNEEHTIHLKSNVLLKLLQETLCIKTSVESGLNSLEKAFLIEKDVI